MWQFDRLTTSRVARWSAMRMRVFLARRTRASFLFIAFLDSSGMHSYFFFVSLIFTYSFAYRTPLPLYGSGGR